MAELLLKKKYKIDKLLGKRRGYDREQISIIAMRLLEEVNAAGLDLELDKTPSRRTSRQLREIELTSWGRIEDESYIFIAVPKCNVKLRILPTTEAVILVCKRLGIKLVEEKEGK